MTDIQDTSTAESTIQQKLKHANAYFICMIHIWQKLLDLIWKQFIKDDHKLNDKTMTLDIL